VIKMPAGYVRMRDAMKRDFEKEGMSAAGALKKAQALAAPIWNKRHPENPVGRGEAGGKRGK